jgi:steroid delta-isomerase-like uncharacterized protein
MIDDGSTDLVTLVAAYAGAKSRQDVAAALAVCDDGFVLDTPAFGTRSRGKAETAAQLQAFFAAFPDYAVTLDGRVAEGDAVACWGTVTMSLRGRVVDIVPTGRTARVPFVSVFTGRAGRLTGERFFFDLATLCTQLGVSTDRMAATLAALRAEPAGPAEAHP